MSEPLRPLLVALVSRLCVRIIGVSGAWRGLRLVVLSSPSS